METPLLLTTGALLSTAAALVMLVVLLTRKTYPGFGFWVAGVLCLAVGAGMLIPGVLPSHWLVRISRNAFLVGGLMLIFHGLTVFRGAHPATLLKMLFFTSFLVIFGYFNIDAAQLDARIVTYSVFTSIACFAGAYTTLKRRPEFFASSDVMLAIWLTIYGLLNVIRLTQQLLGPDNTTAFESLKGIGTFYAAAQILTVQLLTLTLVSMNSQRIEWEYKAGLDELRKLRGDLQATLDAVPDLMFELDDKGTYLQVHAQSPELLVATQANLLKKNVAEVMAEEAASIIMHAIAAALANGRSSGQQICLPLHDGDHWFELSTARMERKPGKPSTVIMLSREITQKVNDHAKIEKLADFDQLTGLPNRTQLRKLFEQAAMTSARHERKLAVVFLDIDHFKNINDTLGHAIGDQLLKEFAHRLRSGLRETDLACRIGGDEFVLVFDDSNIDAATQLSTRLQLLMHSPFDLGPYQSGVTVSIGISIFPDDGVDLDTLLSNADSAMYQAKHEGRNAVRFFTTAMQARAERLLQLSSELGQAIERNELSVWYQPVIRLRDGQVSGCEALSRWQNATLGVVSPSEFIPVAESAGLILALGEWVLKRACLQAREWDFAQRGWVMAVNVSAIQFQQKGFVALLEQVLADTGLEPNCLELELTESVAMDDATKAIDTMDRLRKLGVRIAIDDFGTGYSSMTYLRRLGFHKLKVDQSFVRKIGKDAADESVVIAIIQLAHSLGMDTLAEGVETKEQQEFLRNHACDFQQGWLFSKAIEASKWGQYLTGQGQGTFLVP